MSVVMAGVLAEQIKLAQSFISVYTQIILSLPRTQQLVSSRAHELRQLREQFRYMRTCADAVTAALHGTEAGPPRPPHEEAKRILYLAADIRRFTQAIAETASAIRADEALRHTPMPGSNGRLAGAVAEDILGYIREIDLLLTFAMQYGEARQNP